MLYCQLCRPDTHALGIVRNLIDQMVFALMCNGLAPGYGRNPYVSGKNIAAGPVQKMNGTAKQGNFVLLPNALKIKDKTSHSDHCGFLMNHLKKLFKYQHVSLGAKAKVLN